MEQNQLTEQNTNEEVESIDSIAADGDRSRRESKRGSKQESKRERRDAGWVMANIRDFAQFLTGCWLFLMLTVFPLYFGDKYHEIGGYKYSFFSGTSSMILVPAAVLAVLVLVWNLGKSRLRGLKGEFSVVDAGVLLYMAASAVSFVLSDFPAEAWEGVGGWNMGLRTQLLMGVSYFLISRLFPWKKKEASEKEGCNYPLKTGKGGGLIFCGFFLGSGITFLLGILHRFLIDPLGMYKGIDSSYHIWFLSTIGQATWYSSYVCTVFAVGLCIFFAAESRKIRVLSGIYCVLGFMTLVTQNSDSAFSSMFLLLLGLFAVACGSLHKMERFLEVIILGAASFKAIGLLQWGFADKALELGKLSMSLSKGWISWLVLFLAAACYIMLLQLEEKKGEAQMEGVWKKWGSRMRLVCILVAAAGIVLAVLLIYFNTSGLLQKWFGITLNNQYLLFDNKWGSDRGFIWKTAAGLFAALPFGKKLIGVGPDCFMPYSYSIPEYADKLYQYWKPDILTNAHNEFLNLLICIGIAGLLAFIAMLCMGAARFCRASEKSPLILAGMLCILAYAGSNFFCYQQVCSTPFLFIIMGLAESAERQMARFKKSGG